MRSGSGTDRAPGGLFVDALPMTVSTNEAAGRDTADTATAGDERSLAFGEASAGARVIAWSHVNAVADVSVAEFDALPECSP
jgi:hypothetical protein